MKNRKYFIILGIGVLVLLFTYFLIPTTPQDVNKQMSTVDTMALLKWCLEELNNSTTGETNSFSEDDMISLAQKYLQIQGNTTITYTYEPETAIVDVTLIQDAVNYIFDRDLDMAKTTYEVKDGKIYIPTILTGGDAHIFKYKSREYNKETDTYVINIDCLEPNGAEVDEIAKDTTTSYDQKYVMGTMQIKYRIKDNRYVFLAYNFELVGNR